MWKLTIAGFLICPACLAQEPAPPPQQPPAQVQQSAPSAPSNQTIIVPPGTTIALALESPIQTRLARRGDVIHAATVFPVAVGTEVAIPAGTYVEGTLDKVIKNGPSGRPELKVHFTRMLFSNGYTVSLAGVATTASAKRPKHDLSASAPAVAQSIPLYAMAFQLPAPPPQLTPPPSHGPSMGVAIGIGVGAAVATTVGAILWAHHKRGDVLLDAGWQFQMVLQQPLTLDAQRVASALAVSNAR